MTICQKKFGHGCSKIKAILETKKVLKEQEMWSVE
jgi:hypothetical protein